MKDFLTRVTAVGLSGTTGTPGVLNSTRVRRRHTSFLKKRSNMKLMPFLLAAGVVSLSITALTVSRAADKQRVFALVPKTISVPFYNDVERGCSDEAKKLGVQGKFIGPPTA